MLRAGGRFNAIKPFLTPCASILAFNDKRRERDSLINTRNNRTWRSSLILAFASCYLMWFVTFMAQLHPLIEPRRNNLRESFVSE